MAAAVRVDPKTVFTPGEWARLAVRSPWRGLAMVAHAWATILAGGALFVVWPNPLTLIVAVMVIGARQLGLAILMHEAAHGALHPDLGVNDLVGEWLCAAPVGGDLSRYRPYHLAHHKFAQQDEDPDLGLAAAFPTTRASLRRKVVRDLTGRTFFKQRISPVIGAWRMERSSRGRGPGGVQATRLLEGSRRFLIVNALLFAALAAAGLWWAWFVLWLLPMATWFPLATRIRNIAEHACVPRSSNPFRHARTTRANWVERLLVAPYQVNFHAEHHLFMHVPCWRLPLAHRMLAAKGQTAAMETQPGYFAMLRVAAPQAV